MKLDPKVRRALRRFENAVRERAFRGARDPDAERIGDPMGDLIQANRDQMLRMHEEAVRRVRRRLEAKDIDGALAVLMALNLYHPMHCESWPGWPEAS